MRDALRPQRCEDREVPVGGFAKDSIKPLSGFDDVLNRAILVIRRKLDTVPRGANLNTLSTPPDACRRNSGWSVRTCAVARAIGTPSAVSFSQSTSRRRPISGANRPSSVSQPKSSVLRPAGSESRAFFTGVRSCVRWLALVRRQSISDSWLGNLRECLAHLV